MKRTPELRKLSEDHHHGLVLARHALLAGDYPSALKVWREVEEKFKAELDRHFLIEEEYLAPPLESLGETALLKRFHDDHRDLRSRVLDKTKRSLASLNEFGKILEEHIRFEEREFFETAQSRLSSEDLKRVEKACQTSSSP